jgi:hypothetical protein
VTLRKNKHKACIVIPLPSPSTQRLLKGNDNPMETGVLIKAPENAFKILNKLAAAISLFGNPSILFT